MSCRQFKAFAWPTAVAGATLVFAAGAQADNARAVSSLTGSDANPCTLAQPCRTLQRGINRTPDGGTLHVLDSGSYGSKANIRKSVTILGDEHTVVLGNPVTINDADAKVVLRDLVLNGQGSTLHGIKIRAATTVRIENCVVQSFASHGIFQRLANAELFFIGSAALDNGEHGLFVDATGTTARVTVDEARFDGNGRTGLGVLGPIDVAVRRAVATGNGTHGIALAEQTDMTVARSVAAHNGQAGYSVFLGGQMTLESSAAYGNKLGIQVIFGNTARVSNSHFVNNNTGIHIPSGSTVLTRQNNTVVGNAVDVTGTLTVIDGL